MKLQSLRHPLYREAFVAFAMVALLLPGPLPLRAGDILRGGAAQGSPAQRATAATRSTAAAAAAARANARDNLARTTRAVQSMQAFQNAARVAASGNNAGLNPNAPGTPLPNVPNGLGAGGLEVDPGVATNSAVWAGANLPTQSTANGRTTVNIRQTQQTALLSWKTYNVGRKTTLRYNQSAAGPDASKWVAFNKINDPGNAPSQILGSIEAPGQVYVINRNGIIFGAGSQVNAGTLVASSLPVNDNLIARGLLNNPDAQFLFSGIAIPTGAQGTPAFTPDPVNPAIGRYGDIIVQRGATITSPTNAAKSGGRVMLVGPNVRQGGTISTPNGQTILAAGMQVGIGAHPTSDPSLRGLDVFVGSVDPGSGAPLVGQVEQSGIVSAARGNITLAGRDIRQNGALASSTSVSLNGRIDIQASYDAIPNPASNVTASVGSPFLSQKTGTVSFGAGSVARILPELRSNETTIGRDLALRSQVYVTGRNIHLGRNAAIQAPSGDIRISAGEWRLFGVGGLSPSARFVQSMGQVYLDTSSLIDVAGSTGISVSILQHILSLELRGAELANSPLQRGTSLRDRSIQVDVRNSGSYNGFNWVGTPLADATGFAGLIQRTIGEFTAPGGNVTISAGDSVVLREGSKVDTSGGYLSYKGAKVKTTRLTLGNRLVDIKNATPNRVYDGIYTGQITTQSKRWGVTNTYDQPLALTGERWEESYTEGAAGGKIDIAAPGMALDGDLIGHTVEGMRQREAGVGLSSLRLAFTAQDMSYPTLPRFSPTPPSIRFDEIVTKPAVADFSLDATGNAVPLGQKRLAQVVLSPSILGEDGFGRVTIENPDGNVLIPKGVSMTAQNRGAFSVSASNITINGNITARGGELSFTAGNLPLATLNTLDNTANPILPAASPNRGNFVLGSNASLKTAGRISDDRANGRGSYSLAIGGGSINIDGYRTTISNGATLNVSGGVHADTRGRITYGEAGSLSISGGTDPNLDGFIGGSLSLGGRLHGYSGTVGGTLRIEAPAVQVGGNSAAPGVVRLDPSFFSSGGFAKFDISGTGLPSGAPLNPIPGISIAAGTAIRPVVAGSLALPFGGPRQSLGLTPIVRPEGIRNPVNLTFRSPGASDPYTRFPVVRGDIVVGAGSSVTTDALGRVEFAGETISILGSVKAPSGAITVTAASRFVTPDGQSLSPLATVYLGNGARLSTAGTTVAQVGRNGWREGFVGAGGDISVSGNIVAERGAVLDVSGTAGVLDKPGTYRSVNASPIHGFAGQRYVPIRYHSNGGNISLVGGQMLYFDSTLIGNGGGRSAVGGSLSVSSGRFIGPGDAFTSADPSVILQQNGDTLPQSTFGRGIGLGVRDATGAALPGIGRFVADRFNRSGLSSFSLGGNIRIEGNVSLKADASLRIGSGGVLYSEETFTLTAPYVFLGQAFRSPALSTDQVVLFTQTDSGGVSSPLSLAPTNGSGRLVVNATTIDIGNLSLQGIGSAEFNAARGDIRGNGTLQAAGDIVMRAGQVYPTTATTFNIFAYDSAGGTGSVTFLGGSNRPAPLSAGGRLSVFATDIVQNGTLKAPVGTIELGWDGGGAVPANPVGGTALPAPVTQNLTLGSGSTTSVSAIDPVTGRQLLIPFGISFDGNSWIDPAGNDITVGGAPGKQVSLAGQNVTTLPGSSIDLRGGGDLYAYRWVDGNGGRNDILGSSNLFAIVPGYGFDYAPYAPFNSNASAVNLQGEAGYVNSSLRVGDQITIGSGAGLPLGTYTLLPARYALLPGAFLVTPQGGVPVGTRHLEDGSSLVSGYRSNDLDTSRVGRTEMRRFEIAPGSVVRQRAEYVDFRANTFLRKASASRGFEIPRLPIDAGILSLTATTSMRLRGTVLGVRPAAGRGSLVDISSPVDILINRDGTGGMPGTLVLTAAQLNALGAESLLVGGRRQVNSSGSSVSVSTPNLTIDNEGAPLLGSDFIFVANGNLTVADGADVRGIGSAAVRPVSIGNTASPGTGDGALIRVSGNRNAPVTRFGVGNSVLPSTNVGAGALLTGGSVTVDSTNSTNLDSTARLVAPVLTLNSGQISIQLDNAGALNPTVGLVLSGQALDTIQQVTQRLSLLSYSTLDLYGTGTVGSRNLESLTLQATAVRGLNQGGGIFGFSSGLITLENANGRTFPALPAAPLDGLLRFDADQITLGVNDLRIERFADVELAADARLLVSGEGSFSADGDLGIITPLVTGAAASRHRVSAAGDLNLSRSGGSAGASGGLGARLDLEGATVSLNSDIVLSSGEISVRALTGDLVIGNLDSALLDTGGVSRPYLDVIRHTSAGTVRLSADSGDVRLAADATVDVSAPIGGGDAGIFEVSAPTGSFTLDGAILGNAGIGRRSGSFSLDAATISGDDLAVIDFILNNGSFNESRTYRIRTGDLAISGLAISRDYRAFADHGSITVTGTIDASGATGGTIELGAQRDLIVAAGALLDASARQFSAAGKGGHIALGAGASRDGVIDTTATLELQVGSTLDLSVAAALPSSASRGQFTGTVHLRAPKNVAQTDVLIGPIGSTITDASAIVVEGYQIYDRTGSGTLDNALLAQIQADGNTFLGAGGSASANYGAMLARLTSLQPGLDLILTHGAEIQNRTGSLTLGSTASTEASDWNLAPLRFGPRSAAGFLTLRASDNLDFFNALSDGFAGGPSLWLSPLVAHNPLLPANSQSWSYQMAAGADFSAADASKVRPLDELGADAGMIRLGKNVVAPTATGGNNALTSSIITNRFQVIRTGSGFIDINAGRSFQLRNIFASVYTAGTQVADPTGVFAPSDFVTPIHTGSIAQGSLGAVQQAYAPQYSMAGGHVSIRASENIERKTADSSGVLYDDSSRQLPNNWLYRRGFVGNDGQYGVVSVGSGFNFVTDPAASTSWWVDFSNFFQSIGALGGGDVTLVAGAEVRNVDAVIPTNARAARGVASPDRILELGGGDLLVKSGADINGGVYYVERGVGRLEAGGSITTNSTRSPSRGILNGLGSPLSEPLDSSTWMPTTLFVGRSSFDIYARGDVLLGPIANPFLLPGGINNRHWYKTYFSTYGAESSVNVTSLGGDISLRNSVNLPTRSSSGNTLAVWMETQNLLTTGSVGSAISQPWLRLLETSLDPFGSLFSLAPPSLSLTSLSGDINLNGTVTLAPSSSGQFEVLAAGAINGLQPTGRSTARVPGQNVVLWDSTTINVSDADPSSIPSPTSPFNYFRLVGSSPGANNSTRTGFLSPIARLFVDSGSTAGAFAANSTKQALHSPGLLHRNDTNPLRIYALGGDLSGITLFSPKAARIHASRDIADIAFYLQNLPGLNVSTVTAGRDIIPYNSSTPLRSQSLSLGNAIAFGRTPLAGDIHLGGPGTLQVLAGRNLDLGTGPSNADGSGTGLLTIGNLRNPFLPAAGADLVIGAGLGRATSLAESRLAIDAFIKNFVRSPEGRRYLNELGVRNFESLDNEDQARTVMEVFYLVLRDAGRDFNNEKSPDFGTYKEGFAAIQTLFGRVRYSGEILTRGRNIRTQNGGDISIFAPGGGLTMANSTIGNPLVPPGIVTESGGRVSIFTRDSVDIGVGRIFTLRGGDMVIWSSRGDIAAGVASKTVQSAPPTRVLIDPQSGAVETDLAGLATGGGIGVLATVAGVKPGNVDLIAPAGVIDAGDAGIRVTGNINLAATQVVNASNIAAGGTSSGAPSAPSVSAPSLGGLTAGASSTAAASTAAMDAGDNARNQNAAAATSAAEDLTPSVITVEVLGYGGGGNEEEEEEER